MRAIFRFYFEPLKELYFDLCSVSLLQGWLGGGLGVNCYLCQAWRGFLGNVEWCLPTCLWEFCRGSELRVLPGLSTPTGVT